MAKWLLCLHPDRSVPGSNLSPLHELSLVEGYWIENNKRLALPELLGWLGAYRTKRPSNFNESKRH